MLSVGRSLDSAAGCEWAGTGGGISVTSLGECSCAGAQLVYQLLPSRNRLSESRAAAIPIFPNTSVLIVGLGARLEKEPRATDTTSTAPEDEAPYLERDLLLEPNIYSLLFAVGNAASDWIKCLTSLIPFPSAGRVREGE